MPDPPDLALLVASIAEPEVAPFDPVPQGYEARSVPEAEAATDAGGAEPVVDGATTIALPPSDPDFAAAEAEAAAFAGDLDEDGAPSAQPSGTQHAPVAVADPQPTGERTTTRVVVLGLVSVASIATFKRSLGRAPGVTSIGVASGPDGEFVFTVGHDSGLGLADAITALPGFEARIHAEAAGRIEVTAHDPDAGD